MTDEDTNLSLDPQEFVNTAILEPRVRMLAKSKLKKDTHGDYEIPETGWSTQSMSLIGKANYTAIKRDFGNYVSHSYYDSGLVIKADRLMSIPMEVLDRIIDVVRHLEDYPIYDEDTWSNIEYEAKVEAWNDYGRKEFGKIVLDIVLPYFEDKFTKDGESKEEIVEEYISWGEGNDVLDKIFDDYEREYSTGSEWECNDSGSVSLRGRYIIDTVNKKGLDVEWVRAIQDALWPEDPRQLKFGFAERIVRRLLAGCANLIETLGAARVMVATLLEDAGPHDYSCALINAPKGLADRIVAWGNQQIPNESLYLDDKGGCGREEEPHVTVLYGLQDAIPPQEFLDIVGSTNPFEITLEPITLFRNEKYDVVKMSVSSPELRELNRRVREGCKHVESYPDYKPHITLAYVKPGTCDRLEGTSPFDDSVKMGQTSIFKDGKFTADKVVFSSFAGVKKPYDFKGCKSCKENLDIDPAHIANLAGAMGKKVSLQALRTLAGKEVIQSAHLFSGSGKHPAGEVMLITERGHKAYITEFCSLSVLAGTMRNWRNLKGVKLYVDYSATGEVGYNNPALITLSNGS